MEHMVLTIPSIHCHHCARTIRMEAGELAGVNSVEVDVARKIATINFEEPASPGKIREFLADLGYPPVD